MIKGRWKEDSSMYGADNQTLMRRVQHAGGRKARSACRRLARMGILTVRMTDVNMPESYRSLRFMFIDESGPGRQWPNLPYTPEPTPVLEYAIENYPPEYFQVTGETFPASPAVEHEQ